MATIGTSRPQQFADRREHVPFDVGMSLGDHRPVQGQQQPVEPAGCTHRRGQLVAEPGKRLGGGDAAGPGLQPYQADNFRLLGPGAQRLE